MVQSKTELQTYPAISRWLKLCAVMVLAMAAIGAVTRLTESGLSIVDWKPFMGAVPPLSESDWQATFDQYKTSPQYTQVNAGMTLGEFKTIFFWEYIHRLWGRLIGLVVLVPALWFAWQRRLPRWLWPHLALVFGLGALQGLAGWWMVKSGLIYEPRVSAVRLSVHLGLALGIYGYLSWLALKSKQALVKTPLPSVGMSRALLGFLFLTLLSGALVAGLDAGLVNTDYPFMNGHLIPQDYAHLTPFWRNIVENPATAQFHHRVLTLGVLIMMIGMGWRFARNRLFLHLLGMVGLQFLLGVGLLHVAQATAAIPPAMGAVHQVLAFLIFGTTVKILYGSQQQVAG